MTKQEQAQKSLDDWKTAALAAATSDEERDKIMAKYKFNQEFLKAVK